MSVVFDRQHFDSMTGGDHALQSEVITLFRDQVEGWRQALAGDAWRDAAHTLKGSARGIGLGELALACEAVEQGAPAPAVLEALERALIALTAFTNEASAP
jgi:HPt (histidine-containing phosphotransfer) domain-containing protein